MRRGVAIAVAVVAMMTAAVVASHAQESPKRPRIGILAPTSTRLPQYTALRQALRDLGYEQGRNLVVEERAAEGRTDRLAEFAHDLVRHNVDVILAPGPEATLRAARQATRTIPIVMMAVDYDPMALGYVASLARPGGNVTGVFLQQLELSAKRLELLKESMPGVSRVGVLWDEFSADQWKVVQRTAPSMGLQVQSFELRDPPYDFDRAFQTASRAGIKALLVLMSPVFFGDRVPMADLAAKYRLATMFGLREWPDSGGLMSYGASISDMYVRAAAYVDKILKGANPADLPVEQPTKLELVINQRAAKTLGMTIPTSLLLRADHIIK